MSDPSLHNAHPQHLFTGRLHQRCDLPDCECPKGREHHIAGTGFEIVRCSYCGSKGCHIRFVTDSWREERRGCDSDSTRQLLGAEGWTHRVRSLYAPITKRDRRLNMLRSLQRLEGFTERRRRMHRRYSRSGPNPPSLPTLTMNMLLKLPSGTWRQFLVFVILTIRSFSSFLRALVNL